MKIYKDNHTIKNNSDLLWDLANYVYSGDCYCELMETEEKCLVCRSGEFLKDDK